MGLLLRTGTTSAQDPRDAGVFADEAGTQSTLTVEPYVPSTPTSSRSVSTAACVASSFNSVVMRV